MSKVKFTASQSNAIYTKKGSLLVSAGAGSGKTAVLTQRVIEKLTNKEEYIPADSLLISTFTKSASAEMKQRIEEKLDDLLNKNPDDKFLKNQQILLANAQISTIHSLCQSIIKDNYHKLNLQTGYRVADDKEISILKDRIFDEVLEEYYKKEDENFLNLANMFASRDDKKLRELISDVYQFIISYPYPLITLCDITDDFINIKPLYDTKWYKQINKMVKSYSQIMFDTAKLISEYVNNTENSLTPKAKESLQKELDKTYSFINTLNEKNLNTKNILEILPKKEGPRINKEKDGKIIPYREKLFLLIDEIKSIVNFNDYDYQKDMEYLKGRIIALKDIVTTLYNRIQEEKQKLLIIDYNDMEHFAIELLCEFKNNCYYKTSLAKDLSKQYNEIMVDECQDLNLSQNIIFWCLSKGSNCVSADIDNNELLKGSKNLFMVGDVKQSIYRFRGAKPKLFVKRKDVYNKFINSKHEKNSLSKITLKDNFRSRKEVIDSVNAIFFNIMSKEVGDIEYSDDELLKSSGKFIECKGDKTTEIHIVDTTNFDESGVEVEAKYVANLIQNMIDDGFEINDKGVVRKCTYKDFCILLRTAKNKTKIYADKLKDIGIDSYVTKTQGYLSRYEVVLIMDLLRVIDNPLIDTALLSIMMSQIFGFSDDEIARIRMKNTNQPLYLNLLDEKNYNNLKVTYMLDKLNFLREKSVVTKTDKLIQIIFDETDFMLMMSVMPNGEQRKANLRLLISLAKEYESFGNLGLSGFIRYIDRAIDANYDFESANTISEKANAVKIETIHNSKGLEYPICIVADTAKEFNKMDIKGDYVLDETLGFGIKTIYNEHKKKYNNITNKSSVLSIEKDTLSEEMRILYVAMTRAREKLIITGNVKKTQNMAKSLGIGLLPQMCKNYMQWLMIAGKDSISFNEEFETQNIGNDSNFPVKYKYIKNFEMESTDIQKKKFTAKSNGDIVNSLKQKFEYKYEYEELTQIPAKVTVTQIAKSKQDNKIFSLGKMDIQKEDKISGAKKGDILHKFMQYTDFDNAINNLDCEINRLYENGFLTKKECDNLNKKNIQKFLNSSLMNKIKDSKKIYKEYQFIYEINAVDVNEEISDRFKNEKVLIQGIADLIIEDEEYISIVDYKTDYMAHEQDFIDKYQKQLLIYKDAMTKYFDKPVKDCIIYSLHLGKEIII